MRRCQHFSEGNNDSYIRQGGDVPFDGSFGSEESTIITPADSNATQHVPEAYREPAQPPEAAGEPVISDGSFEDIVGSEVDSEVAEASADRASETTIKQLSDLAIARASTSGPYIPPASFFANPVEPGVGRLPPPPTYAASSVLYPQQKVVYLMALIRPLQSVLPMSPCLKIQSVGWSALE